MSEEIDLDPAEICARGVVTAADVRAMRQGFNRDLAISEVEADWLLAINSRCSEQAPEWREFFIEALTDYIVRQAKPEGYVTVENADWLIERISADGIVNSATELELLVHVLDEARWSPPRLVAFALDQVKRAVVDGKGPLRDGTALTAGTITADEVALIRRVLYAYGGAGHLAVTRTEAEILFAINDASAEVRNDPEWSELFVKAIANALMFVSGHAVPSREEALKREQWLESGTGGVGDFLTRMSAGGLSGFWRLYREQTEEERALEQLERERLALITAEEITAAEAEWLSERIGRDGVLHENEKALLAFIKAESPKVHPSLEPLIERAAA
jgi:hypothetical protein